MNSYPAIEYLSDGWQPDFTGYKDYQSRLKTGAEKLSLDGSTPGNTAFRSKPYSVILSDNPVTIHPMLIRIIDVVKTIRKDVVVYQSGAVVLGKN